MKTERKKWTPARIILLRKRHDLTQRGLSKLLGGRQQTVSEWENGDYEVGNAYSRLLDYLEETLEGVAREVSKGKTGQS